ncbi:MAG: CDP-glycerol glycerophosphotransferase family protein [Eubacteriales bacterium]|nr:CDP-glycerol glycerophosphotransferase family protein [Eubacteriales bacterium]
MSELGNKLKDTPVWKVWCVAKKVPFVHAGWKLMKKARSRIHRFYTLKVWFPHVYKKYASQPVDEKKVVFVEIRLNEITNSFRLLHQRLEESGKYEIHDHFLRNSFVPSKVYDRNCVAFLKDIATAKYVFVNEASNVLGCIKKRPETIVTQTWHGCGAFKKFGFSTAELIFGLTRKEMLKYPFYTNYTYVTLSSPEVAWAYEEAMNLHDRKEVLQPVGISRTDVFFDPVFIENAYAHLHEVMPESKGKKVIAYAPTFRGRVAHGQAPDRLDIPMMREALGEDYVLLIKQHPLVRNAPEIPADCASFALDVTDKMSIDDLLCVSDICISDYSSLVFEYSLFERPMIFFAYDLDEYFDWRGFYYDYYEMAPGPIYDTTEQIVHYIQNIDTEFDRRRVADFRNKFMSACDGHATDRILELISAK